MRHIENIVDTLNPKGGRGLGQTILALALIGAIMFLSYNEVNVPKEFYGALTGLIGYIIADNKKVEKKEGEN